MTTQLAWVQQELAELAANSKDYKEKALLYALEQYVLQQQERIEQAQAEIDGRMWSPSNW